MKKETFEKIVEKAKTKKDGIYQFGGYHYRVVNKSAKFFAGQGDVFECAFGWLVKIGSYNWQINSPDPKRILKNIQVVNQ